MCSNIELNPLTLLEKLKPFYIKLLPIQIQSYQDQFLDLRLFRTLKKKKWAFLSKNLLTAMLWTHLENPINPLTRLVTRKQAACFTIHSLQNLSYSNSSFLISSLTNQNFTSETCFLAHLKPSLWTPDSLQTLNCTFPKTFLDSVISLKCSSGC